MHLGMPVDQQEKEQNCPSLASARIGQLGPHTRLNAEEMKIVVVHKCSL